MCSLSATKPDMLDRVEEKMRSSSSMQEDLASFSTLYRRYVTSIYRYLYSRLGNVADSEDLTAQVFSEAFESLERYQERGSFAAWLFTIAHRRVIDYYRRQRPQIALDEALSPFIDSTGPLDQVMRTESLHQLLRLVAQLDDDKQELLRLRFAAGLTYKEMALVTGRSEAAVKMALRRLLRRLRRSWEAQNE